MEAAAEQEAFNLSLAAHEGSLAFLPSFHVIGFTQLPLQPAPRHALPAPRRADEPTSALLRAATELRRLTINVPVLLEAMLPLDADTIATLRVQGRHVRRRAARRVD